MEPPLLDPSDTCGREPPVDTCVDSPAAEHNSSAPLKWRETLFPDMRPPKKFNLRFIPPKTRDDKLIGVCQKTAVEGELAVLDLTRVGFFLGRRPSFSLVKTALLRQWKLQGNVEIIQMIQGGYAFRFSDLRDRDNILEGDAYFVGGQPMFLRAWEQSLHTGGILGLRKIPLWVSLPDLPLHLWGEEALSSVCSVLGIPLYADRNTALKTRLVYARVCVEFSGDKPMLESIDIEDDLGLFYEQKVIYDWKPPHCLTCGVFGHVECGMNEVCMEHEENSLKKDSNHTPDLSMAQQKNPSGSGLMEKETGRRSYETMSSAEVEEGWETVRARKKKAVGSGAPKPGSIRPETQGVKSGTNAVSTPHWKRLNLSANQVSRSVFFPKMAENSNFKTCPLPEPGPPSHSEKVARAGTESIPPFEPLDLSQPIVTTNPGPSSGIEPLESPKDPESIKPGKNGAGTSAGHTPFPTRLASLAREMRRRNWGKDGIHNAISGPKFSGEASSGSPTCYSTPFLAHPNKDASLQPGKDRIFSMAEDGNCGIITARTADSLVTQRKENSMTPKNPQDDRDINPTVRHDPKLGRNCEFTVGYDSRHDLTDDESHDLQIGDQGRTKGGKRNTADFGHGMANFQ